MNKRKLFTLALSICMVAILALGGTLAYLTDEDQAENVFTFGNVKIEQREQQRVLEDRKIVEDEATEQTNMALETFEDDKNVFPAVLKKLDPRETITVEGYPFKIRNLKGNYVDKIVSVYNIGTEEAYIRTIIAIPSMNGYDDNENATENPLHWNYLDATDFKNEDGEPIGWDWNGSNDAEVTKQKEYVQGVKIGGIEYDIYVATYNKAVAAESWTSPSMVGFYLDDDVDYDSNSKTPGYYSMQDGKRIDLAKWMVPGEDGKVTLKILVASQACQTAGFNDAWEALDEAFGAITADNLPWEVDAPAEEG